MEKVVIEAKRAFKFEEMREKLSEYFSEEGLSNLKNEEMHLIEGNEEEDKEAVFKIGPLRALAYDLLNHIEWKQKKVGGRNSRFFDGNYFTKEGGGNVTIATQFDTSKAKYQVLWLTDGKIRNVGTAESIQYAVNTWPIKEVGKYIIE